MLFILAQFISLFIHFILYVDTFSTFYAMAMYTYVSTYIVCLRCKKNSTKWKNNNWKQIEQ